MGCRHFATKVTFTFVDDCAHIAEYGLKPPFESPHLLHNILPRMSPCDAQGGLVLGEQELAASEVPAGKENWPPLLRRLWRSSPTFAQTTHSPSIKGVRAHSVNFGVCPCAAKTCAVHPGFARVVGELWAADPSNVRGNVQQMLVGDTLRCLKRRFSQKTADLRGFTPSPGNSSSWRAQETAENRRYSQKTVPKGPKIEKILKIALRN